MFQYHISFNIISNIIIFKSMSNFYIYFGKIVLSVLLYRVIILIMNSGTRYRLQSLFIATWSIAAMKSRLRI